ncbi:hypothetical protein L596_012092 [Steinernema carpocapsae]|uniref:Uncharacterized protein n=1 Tax=Steinernema carpocapsae TaxID=34508 RepID=A0A4U5NWN5_STECR|nr:hypothetical protein L596_012092 [Steinernema carpocapsae]
MSVGPAMHPKLLGILFFGLFFAFAASKTVAPTLEISVKSLESDDKSGDLSTYKYRRHGHHHHGHHHHHPPGHHHHVPGHHPVPYHHHHHHFPIYQPAPRVYYYGRSSESGSSSDTSEPWTEKEWKIFGIVVGVIALVVIIIIVIGAVICACGSTSSATGVVYA